MAYKLIVTEHSDELLDDLIYHLIYRLKNQRAAEHLLNEIENIYNRLEKNPRQFPLCKDAYLASKGYHEAIVSQMNYIVIFSIGIDTVNVVGIFHQLENYQAKL